MNKRLLVALAVATVWPLITAGSCAHDRAEPAIETRIVQVPVPVPCVVDVDKPAFADSDAALKAASNLFERVKLLVAARLQRMAYEAELEAAHTGCKGGPP